MKRLHTSELQQPPQKLNESPALRNMPPKEIKQLKDFIVKASDKTLREADFRVDHLLTTINTGTFPTVEKILKSHPELVNQCGRRWTPLMAALRQNRRSDSFCLRLIQRLLDYGANPFLVGSRIDEDLLTPMEFITQKISNVDENSKFYKKCRKLFEKYAEDLESQTCQENVTQTVDPHATLEVQDLNKSELTQYFESLLDEPEPKLEQLPKKKRLKQFILEANDEEMKDANFIVEDLITMIYSGTIEIVEKMLKFHKELVNQYGKSGRTPLMTALRQNKYGSFSLTMVEKLLDYGADPFLIDDKTVKDPLTPMEFIIQKISNVNKTSYLYEKFLKCRKLFEKYAENLESQTCQENVTQTVDPHATLEVQNLNKSELTQYFESLLDEPEPKLKQPPIKKRLKQFILEANDEEMKDTNFRVEDLITMIYSGTLETVEKMLKFHKELVNQHGKSGRTPLMTALRQEKRNSFSLTRVEKLLDYGADPFLIDNEKVKDPLTPMEFIIQKISNVDKKGYLYEKFLKCRELFEEYAKKTESQTRQENSFNLNQPIDQPSMRESQDLSESTLIEYLGDLLDQAETILPESASSEQGQFYDNNQETDLFTAFPFLIPDNSKTTESKNKLTASTDFLEVLPALTSLKQSQVYEKNVETEQFAASPSLILDDNKITQKKNELTASTDFLKPW